MAIKRSNIVSLGSGPPVVMLHSALSSKIQWFRLMHRIRADFLAIAGDFYGYGDSPMPDTVDGHTLNREIDLIKPLVDEIIGPYQRFHLVGHSFGGATALRWCLRERERIISVSVYEPVAFHLLPKNGQAWQNVMDVVTKMDELLTGNRRAEAAEFFVDHWNGTGTYRSLPEEAKAYFEKTVVKLPLDSHAIMYDPATTSDFAGCRTPICLIAGKQSPMEAHEVIKILDNAAPNSSLHWIDSNHMAPVSDPGEVNRIIETFIRRV